MTPEPVEEIEERLARLRGASGNGATTASPHADDLDWFLFHSFPGSDVEAARFADLLPAYERAVAAGAFFDFELLFVRLLELGDKIAPDGRRAIARAAMQRALDDGFDPADAIAAVRFGIRVLPDVDAFLDHLLEDEERARLRFLLTIDFVLDERELSDYLALSYLRDGDPDAAPVLEAFPLAAGVERRLAAFFAEAACRRRLEQGWVSFSDPQERAMLREALGAKLPGFRPT